jgi:hypothetical protein
LKKERGESEDEDARSIRIDETCWPEEEERFGVRREALAFCL